MKKTGLQEQFKPPSFEYRSFFPFQGAGGGRNNPAYYTKLWLTVFLSLFLYSSASNAQEVLRTNDFKNPPLSSKVHTWWHWMAGNITMEGITKDLESMKQQGISTATILNIGEIYSQNVEVPKVKFNSPEWLEMFYWALTEANRIGITIGIHPIDGFSTAGGPWITPELSMKQYTWTKTSIEGGKQVSVQLPQPIAIENYYQDVAVIAYPMTKKINLFQQAVEEVKVNNVTTDRLLIDSNPNSKVVLKKNDVVELTFNEEFTANKLALLPLLPFSWDDMSNITVHFELSSSTDGVNYHKVADLVSTGVNKTNIITFPSITSKYYRLGLSETNFVYFSEYPIAELELLKNDEEPLFSSGLTSFFEKTVRVFDVNENALDDNENTNIPSIVESSIVDITEYFSPEGNLNWKAPKGEWQVIRFGYTSTGVKNDPATHEGEGLEVNKMDTSALNFHFKSYAQKLIQKAGSYKGNTLKFILMDSWEAKFQSWTKAFPEEFLKRRGYSIYPWIPVLCGEIVGNIQLSEAFLHDFRKTIADLIDENFYKHYSNLCHRNNLEFHGEVIYSNWGGYPPLDPLKSNAWVDVPMTEFWAENNENNMVDYKPSIRPKPGFPTFAALAHDKQIIASEAYTGYAHYSETPADLKPFGDAAYCSGVNQLVLHSFVHQPFDKKPGMTLGKFGGHYNRNNPLWEFTQDWMAYQARVQYVLQKGEPVLDVVLYIGDELPQFFSKSFLNDLPFGTQAMACNYDILMNRAKVIDGMISFGGKQSFPLLLLPNRTKMDLATLKQIAHLVREGAVIYGPKPLEMLSVQEIKHETVAFHNLVDSLWGPYQDNAFGKGRIISGKPLNSVLEELGVLPDLTTNTNDPKEFMFIHKRNDNEDIYFLFNQQNKILNREILFKVTGKSPEIWNPENGSVLKPAIYAIEKNQTRIPVTFKPYESKIFIFKNESPDYFIRQVLIDNKKIFPQQQLSDSLIAVPNAVFEHEKIVYTTELTGEYTFSTHDNKIIKRKLSQPKIHNLEDLNTLIEFFPISDEVIKPVEVSKLTSLTEFEDPAIKYFAGKARYTINFAVPDNYLSASDSIVFDLGRLSATAEVILNGRLLAYAWQPNTRLAVSDILRAENKLEITVANAARNRFIGDLIQYGSVKSLWTTSPIETILNKDMPLKPSGLMGPLKLIGYSRQ
jgi:hypothetical protein